MDKLGRLPDRIRHGVRVLFVGINPGLRSAQLGHHFAGYSNRFWKLLTDSGLVSVPVTYLDDTRLPEWGFGITNIIARPSPGIDELQTKEYEVGRKRLLAKIARYRPQAIALLGVTLYPVLFPTETRRTYRTKVRRLRAQIGLQPVTLAGARVYVLPNPSGRNAHYSYDDMLEAFQKLKPETLRPASH